MKNGPKLMFITCVSDSRPPHSIETLSAAAEKASGIPAYLPNCLLLKDTIRRAQEWLQEAEELQVRTYMKQHAQVTPEATVP